MAPSVAPGAESLPRGGGAPAPLAEETRLRRRVRALEHGNAQLVRQLLGLRLELDAARAALGAAKAAGAPVAAAEAAAQAERAADAALAAWGSPPAAEALRGALESAEAAARGALATKTVDGSLGVLAASAAAASARAEASAGAAAADAGVAEEMRVLLARLAVDGGVSAAQRGADAARLNTLVQTQAEALSASRVEMTETVAAISERVDQAQSVWHVARGHAVDHATKKSPAKTLTSADCKVELEELRAALEEATAARDAARTECEALRTACEGLRAQVSEQEAGKMKARAEEEADAAAGGRAARIAQAVVTLTAAQQRAGEGLASVSAKRPLAPQQVARWMQFGGGDASVADALRAFPSALAPLVAKVLDTETLELRPSASEPYAQDQSRTNLEALLAATLSSATQVDGSASPFALSRSTHGTEVDALPVSVSRLSEALLACDEATAGDEKAAAAARGARVGVAAAMLGDLHFRGADVGVTYALSSFLSAAGGGSHGDSDDAAKAAAHAALQVDARIDAAVDKLYAGSDALASRGVGSDAECVALIDAFAEDSTIEATVCSRVAEVEQATEDVQEASSEAAAACEALLELLPGADAGGKEASALVSSFAGVVTELHERAGSAQQAVASLREGAREAHARLAAYEGRVARVDTEAVREGMREYAAAAIGRGVLPQGAAAATGASLKSPLTGKAARAASGASAGPPSPHGIAALLARDIRTRAGEGVSEILRALKPTYRDALSRVLDVDALTLLPGYDDAAVTDASGEAYSNLETLFASLLSSRTLGTGQSARIPFFSGGERGSEDAGGESATLLRAVRRLSTAVRRLVPAMVLAGTAGTEAERGAVVALLAALLGDAHARGAQPGFTYLLANFVCSNIGEGERVHANLVGRLEAAWELLHGSGDSSLLPAGGLEDARLFDAMSALSSGGGAREKAQRCSSQLVETHGVLRAKHRGSLAAAAAAPMSPLAAAGTGYVAASPSAALSSMLAMVEGEPVLEGVISATAGAVDEMGSQLAAAERRQGSLIALVRMLQRELVVLGRSAAGAWHTARSTASDDTAADVAGARDVALASACERTASELDAVTLARRAADGRLLNGSDGVTVNHALDQRLARLLAGAAEELGAAEHYLSSLLDEDSPDQAELLAVEDVSPTRVWTASSPTRASATAEPDIDALCRGAVYTAAQAIGAHALLTRQHDALARRSDELRSALEEAKGRGIAAPADDIVSAVAALSSAQLSTGAADVVLQGGGGKPGASILDVAGGMAGEMSAVADARAHIDTLSREDGATRAALLGVAGLLTTAQRQVHAEREAAAARLNDVEAEAVALRARLAEAEQTAEMASAKAEAATAEASTAAAACEKATARSQRLEEAMSATRGNLLRSTPEEVAEALDHLATAEAKRYEQGGASAEGLAHELATALALPEASAKAMRGGQVTAEQHAARLMAAQALGEDADSKRALLQVASLLAAERAAVAAARRVARDATQRAEALDSEAEGARREAEAAAQRVGAAMEEVQAQCRRAAEAQAATARCGEAVGQLRGVVSQLTGMDQGSDEGRSDGNTYGKAGDARDQLAAAGAEAAAQAIAMGVGDGQAAAATAGGIKVAPDGRPLELWRQVDTLRKELEGRAEAVRAAAKRTAELEGEAKALRAELAAVRNDVADAADSARDAKERLATESSQAARWRERAEALEKSLADATAKQREARGLWQETLIALKRAKEDNTKLAGHVATLEGELEDILASDALGYQATAPAVEALPAAQSAVPPSPRAFATPMQLFSTPVK